MAHKNYIFMIKQTKQVLPFWKPDKLFSFLMVKKDGWPFQNLNRNQMVVRLKKHKAGPFYKLKIILLGVIIAELVVQWLQRFKSLMGQRGVLWPTFRSFCDIDPWSWKICLSPKNNWDMGHRSAWSLILPMCKISRSGRPWFFSFSNHFLISLNEAMKYFYQ
jgi:hypothetical protein